MSTLFFMPGAVVIRARRDGPEVRLPPGWARGFFIWKSERARGPVSWRNCCWDRHAGGDEEEQPLYFEAGGCPAGVSPGLPGVEVAPFQGVDALKTRLVYEQGPEMASWGRAGFALDRLFRRMYLVGTRMGMLFSDWRSAMLLFQPDWTRHTCRYRGPSSLSARSYGRRLRRACCSTYGR